MTCGLDGKNRTTDSLTYKEFRNQGPSAATSGRVDWVGYKTVSNPEELQRFTIYMVDRGTRNELEQQNVMFEVYLG
ncbi:hypothetical protein BUALT_Bualt01G0110200 [Buddleja alternifolia]|uniref:Pectinesterase catalytic domain-containing protein n=1 Tax=Buddleja alternifolia TaxID=168488 RepID=A0AAV6YD49_9LAMI|nr:hypothetical protein BUALT_Bualt01G0110200 [Buddleja alternifolia]